MPGSGAGLGGRLPSLGPRGEGWVVLQAVLIVLVGLGASLGPGWPAAARPWLLVAGAVAGALGVGLLLWGVVALGSGLTPLPRPADGARLRERGPFRLVRHPVYGGVILLGAGWTLTVGPLGLVPVVLLAGFLALKALREEAWLIQHVPGYGEYMHRVRRRFVPWLV